MEVTAPNAEGWKSCSSWPTDKVHQDQADQGNEQGLGTISYYRIYRYLSEKDKTEQGHTVVFKYLIG